MHALHMCMQPPWQPALIAPDLSPRAPDPAPGIPTCPHLPAGCSLAMTQSSVRCVACVTLACFSVASCHAIPAGTALMYHNLSFGMCCSIGAGPILQYKPCPRPTARPKARSPGLRMQLRAPAPHWLPYGYKVHAAFKNIVRMYVCVQGLCMHACCCSSQHGNLRAAGCIFGCFGGTGPCTPA